MTNMTGLVVYMYAVCTCLSPTNSIHPNKKACWNNSAERWPSEIFDIPISRCKLSYSVFNWFFVLFYSNLLMNFSIILFTVISGRPWSRFDVVSFWFHLFYDFSFNISFFSLFHRKNFFSFSLEHEIVPILGASAAAVVMYFAHGLCW